MSQLLIDLLIAQVINRFMSYQQKKRNDIILVYIILLTRHFTQGGDETKFIVR